MKLWLVSTHVIGHNVLDVVNLVNIILNSDDYVLAGDMNQDGVLDILDIVTLVNIILS